MKTLKNQFQHENPTGNTCHTTLSAPPSEPPCRSRPVEPLGRWSLFGNFLRSPLQSATYYETGGRQLSTFQRSANRWSVTHYAPAVSWIRCDSSVAIYVRTGRAPRILRQRDSNRGSRGSNSGGGMAATVGQDGSRGSSSNSSSSGAAATPVSYFTGFHSHAVGIWFSSKSECMGITHRYIYIYI